MPESQSCRNQLLHGSALCVYQDDFINAVALPPHAYPPHVSGVASSVRSTWSAGQNVRVGGAVIIGSADTAYPYVDPTDLTRLHRTGEVGYTTHVAVVQHAPLPASDLDDPHSTFTAREFAYVELAAVVRSFHLAADDSKYSLFCLLMERVYALGEQNRCPTLVWMTGLVPALAPSLRYPAFDGLLIASGKLPIQDRVRLLRALMQLLSTLAQIGPVPAVRDLLTSICTLTRRHRRAVFRELYAQITRLPSYNRASTFRTLLAEVEHLRPELRLALVEELLDMICELGRRFENEGFKQIVRTIQNIRRKDRVEALRTMVNCMPRLRLVDLDVNLAYQTLRKMIESLPPAHQARLIAEAAEQAPIPTDIRHFHFLLDSLDALPAHYRITPLIHITTVMCDLPELRQAAAFHDICVALKRASTDLGCKACDPVVREMFASIEFLSPSNRSLAWAVLLDLRMSLYGLNGSGHDSPVS